MIKLRLLLLLLVVLLLLPSSASAERKVLIHCPVDQTAVRVDPIKGYGLNPFGHEHTNGGSRTFDENMTRARMAVGNTTCLLKSDRGAVWFPTPLKADGTPATVRSVAYYVLARDGSPDVVDPSGLAFIAGQPNYTGKYGSGVFACVDYAGKSISNTHLLPVAGGVCDVPEVRYIQWTQFSLPCWDGVNFGPGMGTNGGPADAQSHMAAYNSTTDLTCPAGYVHIPRISLSINLEPDVVGGTLSSDVQGTPNPGSSSHFDYDFGFVHNTAGQLALPLLIDQCLNAPEARAVPVGKQSCREITIAGQPTYVRQEYGQLLKVTD